MREHVGAKAVLTDTEQTAWQLAVIQLSGWTSLPILATSVLILRENSFYGAALTIVVGNGLLWFIRLIIILMSHPRRQSTLDLSKQYLGRVGGYCIGALCILSSLSWFVTQTTAASGTLKALVPIHENIQIDRFMQISVLLGVASTLLCMNGMVILRKLSVIAFPLLLGCVCMVLFTLPLSWPKEGAWTLSLSGLAIVMGTNLGITADLPTFFRHSRSLSTSIMALTWIQLISLLLALGALFFGSVITDTFVLDVPAVLDAHTVLLRPALIGLVFLSVICANVANVYSASVGWEVLAPSALVGRREYLILGLCLTTVFILISGLFSIESLLVISDMALINLSIVLLFAYFISRFQRKAPSAFEQKTYFTAWWIATLVNAGQYSSGFARDASSLLVGLMSVGLVLFFLLGSYFIKTR